MCEVILRDKISRVVLRQRIEKEDTATVVQQNRMKNRSDANTAHLPQSPIDAQSPRWL